MQIDQVYIISIDLREEYIEELLDRAKGLPFPQGTPIKVFEGFVGRRLENEQGLPYKLYDGWSLPIEVIQYNFWNRPTTWGEAGGMISHTKIWEDAYEKGHKTIMILEDDFISTEPIDWDIFDETQGYEWEMALLAHNSLHDNFDTISPPIRIGLKHWVKPTFFYNTHSYILRRGAIEKLVEQHLPKLKQNIIVSDEFLSAVIASHPRSDIREMYVSNINAIATKKNYVGQTRWESLGNSLTSPDA
jgi:GR25 family glycosyltransferase involved in LPS biosynthesis